MCNIDIIVTTCHTGLGVVYSSKKEDDIMKNVQDLRGTLPFEVKHHVTDNVIWRFAEQEETFAITAIKSIPPKIGDHVSVWVFVDKSILFTEVQFYGLCENLVAIINCDVLNTKLLDEICEVEYNSRNKIYKCIPANESTYLKDFHDLWLKASEVLHRQQILLIGEGINDIYSDNTYWDKDKRIVSFLLSQNRGDFLCALSDNYNLVSSSVINQLLDLSYIEPNDLIDIGVDKEFVRGLLLSETPLSLGGPSDQLPCDEFKGSELFFFSLPNAGTTSMLGAILSTLASGKQIQWIHIKEDSPSFSYAHRLLNWGATTSQAKVTRFIQSNIKDRTQCLDIEIQRFERGKTDKNIKTNRSAWVCDNRKMRNALSLRIIKMNSNLPFCLYKKYVEDITPEYYYGYTSDYKYLTTKKNNKRNFFFVIPYEEHDLKYGCLSMSTYIESIIHSMEKEQMFDSFVDAIYIIITKVDKISKSVELESKIKQYVEHKYNCVYNKLIEICKKYEINKGEVPIIYFSCGETCFRDFVKINTSFAESFIDSVLLIKEEQPPPKGIRKHLISLFGKYNYTAI